MALTLYGLAFSTCTKRVAATILEKDADYTLKTIDLAKGEHKQAPFLEKQPFGQIPVLEDGDISIFESRAIARYVSEKFAGQGTELLGTTPKEKALVNQWLEVEAQNYNPPISGIVAQKVFAPMFGGTADEAKVAECVEKANKVLDIYEAHLAKNEYLAGDFFSLADLSHLPYTQLLWPAGHSDLITSRPNVNKWWEKISTRPSWVKISQS